MEFGNATVSPQWKYATFGLGALIVAQFFWWQKRVPEQYRIGY